MRAAPDVTTFNTIDSLTEYSSGHGHFKGFYRMKNYDLLIGDMIQAPEKGPCPEECSLIIRISVCRNQANQGVLSPEWKRLKYVASPDKTLEITCRRMKTHQEFLLKA